MSSVERISLPRRIRALRLHRVPTTDAVPVATRGAELFGLRQKAEQDAADREALLSCLQNIEDSLANIPGLVEQNLQQVAALVTELGLTVAREVVGAAVDQGLVDTTAIVIRCLEQVVNGADAGSMRIQLSPDDLSTVFDRLTQRPDVRELIGQIEFVPNQALPRGHVQVETGSGRLLYDPHEVLSRISDEIRKEAQGGAS